MKRAQSGTTLRSMLGWALLLPLAVLLTTGCFRIEMSFVVNEDGSGVFEYTLGVSDEFTALTDSSGEELDEESLPPGAVAREYSEDGYTGYVVTLPFTDYAEIRTILRSSIRKICPISTRMRMATGASPCLSLPTTPRQQTWA